MPDNPPPDNLPPFKSRVFIDDNGDVVFENLDPGLAEVALELDPEAAVACDLPKPPDAPPPDEDPTA